MEYSIKEKNSKVYDFFVFLFAASLIFNSTLYNSIHFLSVLSKILIFSCSIVLFIIGISYLKSHLEDLVKIYGFYLLISVILFVEQILRLQFPLSKFLLLIIFPLLIVPFILKEKYQDSKLFFQDFCNIMTFIALLSLFFTILGLFGFPLNSSINSLWSGGTVVGGYFHLHFFPGGTQKIPFLFFNLLRNSSFFPESPIFGYYLSLALVFQNFLINKDFLDKKSIILYITIFTTASTTALLVAFGTFVIKSMKTISNRDVRLLYSFFLIVLIIFSLYYIFQAKLKNSIGSVSIRSDDFKAAMHAFADHPILGNGFNNLTSIEAYMDANRLLYDPQSVAAGINRAGFSLGLPEMLALGGIYFVFFWLILPSCLYIKKYYKTSLIWLPVFNVFLVSLLIINDSYIFIFTIIYFYVYGMANTIKIDQ